MENLSLPGLGVCVCVCVCEWLVSIAVCDVGGHPGVANKLCHSFATRVRKVFYVFLCQTLFHSPVQMVTCAQRGRRRLWPHHNAGLDSLNDGTWSLACSGLWKSKNDTLLICFNCIFSCFFFNQGCCNFQFCVYLRPFVDRRFRSIEKLFKKHDTQGCLLFD